jgi:hypothetical protein
LITLSGVGSSVILAISSSIAIKLLSSSFLTLASYTHTSHSITCISVLLFSLFIAKIVHLTAAVESVV